MFSVSPSTIPHLYQRDVENIVNAILDEIVAALARGDRVELRGFGAFSVKHRPARAGRNPRTGAHVPVDQKSVPFFKTGKEMRERLNQDSEARSAVPVSGARPAKAVPSRSEPDRKPSFWIRRFRGMSGGKQRHARLLRRIIAAIILVPLVIVIVVFAVANRHIVTVSFDPFSSDEPSYRGDAAAVRADHRVADRGRDGRRRCRLVRQGNWRGAARRARS